jgi:hypothetical protein
LACALSSLQLQRCDATTGTVAQFLVPTWTPAQPSRHARRDEDDGRKPPATAARYSSRSRRWLSEDWASPESWPTFLHWRTRYRPIGAIDAALAADRFHAVAAAFAIIDVLAGVNRHRFGGGVVADRTGDDGLPLHSRAPFGRSRNGLRDYRPRRFPTTFFPSLVYVLGRRARAALHRRRAPQGSFA